MWIAGAAVVVVGTLIGAVIVIYRKKRDLEVKYQLLINEKEQEDNQL
jgi:uncharacterized membrane-anchored protein YhcB (DUF1043 family)